MPSSATSSSLIQLETPAACSDPTASLPTLTGQLGVISGEDRGGNSVFQVTSLLLEAQHQNTQCTEQILSPWGGQHAEE